MEDDEDQKRKGGIFTLYDFIVEQKGDARPRRVSLIDRENMERVTGTFSTLLRDRYISSSAKGSSTGKSPTLTLSGLTNTPHLGAHVKYRFP